MGIFGKKAKSTNMEIALGGFSAEQRKLNVLMGVANAVCQEKPEVTLELTESLESHPDLHKVRGWAYAEKEDLPNALKEFEKGFALGDIGCGIYLHRLLRDHSDDEARFKQIERKLVPYFKARNVRLMYAQARLALNKKDYESAITNFLSIMHEKGQPTVDLYGGTFFNTFLMLSAEKADKVTKNPDEPTVEEVEEAWEHVQDFFEKDLKTAEGSPLGWTPFLYFFSMADYLFREIEEGNFQSAIFLDEFNKFYVELIQQLNPPKPPRTFSKDFIWEAILKSLERGSLNSILYARDFAKANSFPVSEIKKYEDEFNSWGYNKYL
jgi:hypothetical protein